MWVVVFHLSSSQEQECKLQTDTEINKKKKRQSEKKKEERKNRLCKKSDSEDKTGDSFEGSKIQQRLYKKRKGRILFFNSKSYKKRMVFNSVMLVSVARTSAEVWQQMACFGEHQRIDGQQMVDLVIRFPLQQLGRLLLYIWTFLCVPPQPYYYPTYSYYRDDDDDDDTSSDDDDDDGDGAGSSSPTTSRYFYYHQRRPDADDDEDGGGAGSSSSTTSRYFYYHQQRPDADDDSSLSD